MVLLQISQSQLTLIEQCPRKFQYIYLDQLTAPISPDQQEALTRGSQVHHLMQQHELQIPPRGPTVSDHNLALPSTSDPIDHPNHQAQLYQMAEALAAVVPDLDDSTVFRQSEYRLNLEWSDVLLTVIYDLLVLDKSTAHIFDWKTYFNPPNPKKLRQRLTNHWQTKLYPFVLVETSDYSPDTIELSYWFVKHKTDGNDLPSEPTLPKTPTILDSEGDPQALFEAECITFPYSDRLHQQTKQDLAHIIEQVQNWLEEYNLDQPLPKVDESQGICSHCPFRMRCDRIDHKDQQENWESLADITAIPEIQPFPLDPQ